jgi:hypothetical protein
MGRAHVAFGLLFGILFAAVIAPVRDALACGNAVILDIDSRAAKLAEAQRALDEGDVDTARELALEASRDAHEVDDFVPGLSGLVDRAHRIVALATARDSSATEEQREGAVLALTKLRFQRKAEDPALTADYAEAASRIPSREQDAFELLTRLADRDLIGSPYAYGALSRLAKKRGDDGRASMARARCEGMSGSARVCRGDYPSAPLLRGRPLGYALPAGIFLAALAFRLLRARSRRAIRTPWIGHAAPLQTAAIAGAGIYAFARATSPAWSTFVVFVVVVLTFVVERRGFFAAVRRGKVPRLVLRPAGPDDEHVPSLALWFGPGSPEILERVRGGDEPEPGYREAARAPLIRLVAARQVRVRPGRAVIMAVALTAILALAALFSLFTLRGA